MSIHSFKQRRRKKETKETKKRSQNPSTTQNGVDVRQKKDLNRKTPSSQIGDGFIFPQIL